MLEEIVGEITDEYDVDEVEVEHLEGGAIRVSSRYPVDDLDELVGFDVEDEDVDSVGGLMAKHLGKVPIPGSVVECHGLRLEAERATGRRNKIETVLVSVLPADGEDADDPTPAPPPRHLRRPLTTTYSHRIRPDPSSAAAASASRAASSSAVRSGWSARPR